MGSERLKIAYVISTILEPTGGTENQLLHLLAQLDRDRFDPVLYCLSRSPWLEHEYDSTLWNDLRIHLGPRPQLPLQLSRFANELRRTRVDVVQTHFRDANLVGVIAASMAGVRTIISTRRGMRYWNSWFGLWVLRQVNRRATSFLANSQANKDRYVREEGLDPTCVDVIHNGLDPEAFRGLDAGSRRELRKQLGLPPDIPVIGLVANLRPVKGIEDLLRAAHVLRDTHPRAHFVIVGQGPQLGALRALREELGLTRHVHLVGVRRDVPQLLQCFDVGVLCSHFESFSNSVLEYVAASLPVVVTDVGGVRELVRDGHQGFVVPPHSPERLAEKIDVLLAHKGGPRAWPGAGDLDDHFVLSRMVRAHEELYLRRAGD